MELVQISGILTNAQLLCKLQQPEKCCRIKDLHNDIEMTLVKQPNTVVAIEKFTSVVLFSKISIFRELFGTMQLSS